MRPKELLMAALTAGTLLTLGACGTQESDALNGEATTLRDVAIPEDFTFATTRAVALTVSASAEALGAESAPIEIRNSAGHTLLRGPLTAGEALQLNLSLPRHEQTLEVQIGEHVLAVAIEGGAANINL